MPETSSWTAVYVGLAILAPLFLFFERRRPASPIARTWRAVRLDLTYWIVTPIFTGGLSRLLTLGVVAAVGLAAGFDVDGPRFLASLQARMPFARLPWPVAFVLALLLADLLGYLSHRLRHTRHLWPVHAVHHGAEELTALAAARLHPLDEALDSLIIGVPLLLLGVPLSIVTALGPFFVLHTLLLHANVSWSFGPLGRVLASPRFHRRHHARDLPPANFAGVFSLYDVLFGTFEMPEGAPAPCGIPERDVPEGFFAQLTYPLRGRT